MGRSGLVAERVEYVTGLAMVIFFSVTITALGAAAPPEPHPQKESVALKPQEVPPMPCTGDFDWIQFRNGEWLKGEIKELLYDEFTFESDQLDTLELKLDYHMTLGLSESVKNTHHALFMFSIDLWKDLDFDLSFTWDRIEDPQPREDGSVPE